MALVYLTLLGFLWGVGFILSKFAAISDIPPMAYTAWQTGLGGLILLSLCIYQRQLPKLTFQHLSYMMAAGIIGVGIPNILSVLVLSHIDVSAQTLLLGLVPILTLMVSIILGIDRMDRERLAGLALGFLGVLVLVYPNLSAGDGSYIWLVIGAFVPLCYALSTAGISRFRPSDGQNIPLATGMLLSASLTGIIGGLLTDQLWMPDFPIDNAGERAVFVHCLISAFAFVVFFRLIAYAGPVFASQVSYFVTSFGIALGMLIFSEQPVLTFWFAVVLILLGVFIVNRATHRQRRT